MESYSREERNRLEAALHDKRAVLCPVCNVEMTRQDVVPPGNVSYVRHRVWLLCPSCKRSVSLDQR